MAYSFDNTISSVPVACSLPEVKPAARWGGILFRTLVDLGTGDVAGIESARARCAISDPLLRRCDTPAEWFETGLHLVGLRGARAQDKAACLVRCGLTLRPGRIAADLGLDPARAILMFDVGELFREPGRALDLLLCCKRAGARILLDNFDLEDPPARFMEMLPADILRVALRQMPWHWEAARRWDVLASVRAFAGNLLVDVAVEDVSSCGQRQECKRLGVRYVQGGWHKDVAGRMAPSL